MCLLHVRRAVKSAFAPRWNRLKQVGTGVVSFLLHSTNIIFRSDVRSRHRGLHAPRVIPLPNGCLGRPNCSGTMCPGGRARYRSVSGQARHCWRGHQIALAELLIGQALVCRISDDGETWLTERRYLSCRHDRFDPVARFSGEVDAILIRCLAGTVVPI